MFNNALPLLLDGLGGCCCKVRGASARFKSAKRIFHNPHAQEFLFSVLSHHHCIVWESGGDCCLLQSPSKNNECIVITTKKASVFFFFLSAAAEVRIAWSSAEWILSRRSPYFLLNSTSLGQQTSHCSHWHVSRTNVRRVANGSACIVPPCWTGEEGGGLVGHSCQAALSDPAAPAKSSAQDGAVEEAQSVESTTKKEDKCS